MSDHVVEWPKKTREIVNAICDSTRWNGFEFRDGDIVIDTSGKTGSTWTQQIVGQLVLGGADGFGPAMSPWIDHRIFPMEAMLGMLQAQTHRRFLKSHLPVDALVISPKAKYIYVARDACDAVWSMYNHAANFTQAALDHYNNSPGRVGPPVVRVPADVRDFYLGFLKCGGMPMLEGGQAPWPFWSHVQGWWDARGLPNVLLVHYAGLKGDLPGEVRRIADFLGIAIDETVLPKMLEHCSLQYMREQARTVDAFDIMFEGGADTFINKGTNGRWKDVLTPEEIAMADEAAAANLTPECAHWLKTGELPDA
jgi:aryl sulfotransferase